MPRINNISWFCLFSLLAILCLVPDSADAVLVRLLEPQQIGFLEGSYKIIDARPLREWQKGHIPQALSLSWQDYTQLDDPIAYRRLQPEVMAERLGQLGITETTPLIVYGDADSSWGGEGWVCWLLSELGHASAVYLLKGGVQAWQKFSPELSSKREYSSAAPATYRLARRHEIDIATEELRQNRGELQIVDTRSFFEWLRDSIPGAVRINWTHFFTGKDRRPISREQLLELLHKHGIDPEKQVVYYCSGGVRSAYAWTVHELAGLKRAKNYEGGMEAWKMSRIYGR